jgi:hypothetical protein
MEISAVTNDTSVMIAEVAAAAIEAAAGGDVDVSSAAAMLQELGLSRIQKEFKGGST